MNRIKTFFNNWRVGITSIFIYAVFCVAYTSISILVYILKLILNNIL
jgi:hypothetical protein